MFFYPPEDSEQQDDRLGLSLIDTLVFIGSLQHVGLLKGNSGSTDRAYGLLFLTGGIFTSTIIKSTGKYVVEHFNFSNSTTDRVIDILDFTADTIFLPIVSNLWVQGNSPLGCGLYMGLTLDFIPHYINSFTDGLSILIRQHYMDQSLPQQHQPIVPVDLFLPGFVRGIVFTTLKDFTGQKAIPAFIGGAVRGYMLLPDEKNILYSTFIYAINASANQWDIFQFSSVVDSIIDGSTTTITVEYITYGIVKLLEGETIEDDIKELYSEEAHSDN